MTTAASWHGQVNRPGAARTLQPEQDCDAAREDPAASLLLMSRPGLAALPERPALEAATASARQIGRTHSQLAAGQCGDNAVRVDGGAHGHSVIEPAAAVGLRTHLR